MTKRPSCVRNKSKKYCKICKITDDIEELVLRKHKEDKHPTIICIDCWENYCEICGKTKKFITVRVDPENNDPTKYQICSECYLKLSNEIVELDKNYDTIGIDDKKENLLNEFD